MSNRHLAIIKFTVVIILAFQINLIFTYPDDVDILRPFKKQGPPICYTYFRILHEPYKSFSTRLHDLATRNMSMKVGDLPVLPEQTHPLEAPYKWILLDLIGWDDDETTLLLRVDNLYLVAFTNMTGQWHAFKNRDHLIPGSIPLPYANDYPSLTGNLGHKELANVPLGKTSLLEAVRNLSRYDPSISNQEHMRLSLLKILLMINEAQRFSLFNNTVSIGWESESFIPSTRTQLVFKWRDISISLLFWDKNKIWPGVESTTKKKSADLGIDTPQRSLDALIKVLKPRNK